jgi:hypothetical protein
MDGTKEESKCCDKRRRTKKKVGYVKEEGCLAQVSSGVLTSSTDNVIKLLRRLVESSDVCCQFTTPSIPGIVVVLNNHTSKKCIGSS